MDELNSKFKSSAERLEQEFEDRLRVYSEPLMTHVPFLDDAIGGITKTDVMLVGGRTGTGKTELITSIALENARFGKKIALFCLEAQRNEFERRTLYKLVAHEYFADPDRPPLGSMGLEYKNWCLGYNAKELAKYESLARERFEEFSESVLTFYREGECTIKDIERQLLAVYQEVDGIILDHLNYIDVEGMNENQEVSNIVKRIRDLALISETPLIIVAHCRKRDKFDKQLVPSIDDYHGTSNISKIATIAVMLGPSPAQASDPTKFLTLMHVGKLRERAGPKNFVAQVVFDAKTNTYEKKYKLSRYNFGSTEFQELTLNLPRWARNASRGGV